MVITDGRGDCLQQTIESAVKNLPVKEFGCFLIVNDSMDLEYSSWLHDTYNLGGIAYFKDIPRILRFSVSDVAIDAGNKQGFGGAIRCGWQWLMEAEAIKYIYHLEEDFLHEEPIDIEAMLTILDDDEQLAQIALVRDPVAAHEHAAGGLIESRPCEFYQETVTIGPRWNPIKEITWLSHTSFFTTNPCLYRTRLTHKYDWPIGTDSEARFGDRLIAEGYHFGFLGSFGDRPKVKHIGVRTKDWKP